MNHVCQIVTDLLKRDQRGDYTFVSVSAAWPGVYWRVVTEHGTKHLEFEIRQQIPGKRRREYLQRRSSDSDSDVSWENEEDDFIA